VLDHGPLGMRPACGHGHADALSLTLYLNGEVVLIDPGTYGYGLDAEVRGYFRGTRAHNTVVVDEADQALQETSFQWSSPFTAQAALSMDEAAGTVAVLARHDGYAGRGVVHWRCVFLQPETGFVVHDFISGKGHRTLAAHWHFGVNVHAVNGGAQFLAKTTAGEIAIETSGGAPSIVAGATSPMLGWRSPAYGVKHPSPTLRLEHSGDLPHAFTTRVRIDGAFGPLHGEETALKSMMAEVARG
jgi:hypothetical protein